MAQAAPTTAEPAACPAQLTVSHNRLAILLAASPPYAYLFVYPVVLIAESLRGGELVHNRDFIIMIGFVVLFVSLRATIRKRWSKRLVIASVRARAHAYAYEGKPKVTIHNCPVGVKVELGVTIKTSGAGSTVLIDLSQVHWRTDGERRTVSFNEAVYRIARPGAVADLFLGEKATITTPQLPGIVQLLMDGIDRFDLPATT